MLTIVLFKWGDWCEGHDRDYLRRIVDGVGANLTLPHRFVLFTDDPMRRFEGVEIRHLPTADLPGCLPKLWMYSPDCGLEGRILALDLDTLITGSLDEIAAYDGRVCVVEDFFEAGQHGGGVIAFEAGAMTEQLWQPMVNQGEVLARAVAGMERYYYRMMLPTADWWQGLYPGQIVSSKVHCRDGVPDDARLVCFHGNPRPHHCDWKPGQFILETVESRNPLRPDEIQANIRSTLARGLPEVMWGNPQATQRVAVCGGGPSLNEQLPQIKRFKGDVVALNGAHRRLHEARVRCDYMAMVDPRPDCVDFVKDAPAHTVYLIASQCDPAVFDALRGRDVAIWHAAVNAGERQLLHDNARGGLMIGGGCTIGTRVLHLMSVMGARHFHLFGMDSCFVEGEAHAYEQAPRDSLLEGAVTVHCGEQRFQAAAWMYQQAESFKELLDWHGHGFTVDIHGGGLLAAIASQHPNAHSERRT